MTDETNTPQTEPPPRQEEMSNEHPLSLLLFAPLRTEGGQRMIFWGLAIVCLGLAVMGFFVKPGYHFPLESIPLFYGVFGFAAFAGAVLSGWPLGKWLRRPENFYTRKQDDDAGEAGPDA